MGQTSAAECRNKASKLAGALVVELGYLCGDTPGIGKDEEWCAEVRDLMRHASDFSAESKH